MIVLREGFEACLVCSLIFAFLTKTGQAERRRRAVWLGVGAALGASAVVGAILFVIFGELSGTSEAIYEGVAMLVACGVLTWMVFSMRAQARTIGAGLRAQVGEAVVAGGGLALAAVAFVGVAREGLETALFLFVSVRDEGLAETLIGGALGLVAAVAWARRSTAGRCGSTSGASSSSPACWSSRSAPTCCSAGCMSSARPAAARRSTSWARRPPRSSPSAAAGCTSAARRSSAAAAHPPPASGTAASGSARESESRRGQRRRAAEQRAPVLGRGLRACAPLLVRAVGPRVSRHDREQVVGTVGRLVHVAELPAHPRLGQVDLGQPGCDLVAPDRVDGRAAT